ncbi:NUDIX hydrolase [Streptomyces sodiiphilus]
MNDDRAVVKRTARAILLEPVPAGTPGGHSFELIVIKRTKPGRPPYWITPGGGVEPGDATVLAALHREVLEELGAKVTDVVPAFVDTVPVSPERGETCGPGLKVQHFFLCRPVSLDPELRHGPEVDDPCGTYEIVRLPFTRAGLAAVDLVPHTLAAYLRQNIEGLPGLLAPDFC